MFLSTLSQLDRDSHIFHSILKRGIMEDELLEVFESVKTGADGAENSVEDEERCLSSLKRLKKFPVNYHLLVSTQVGKRLRQLTKHRNDKIRTLAFDVVEIWKEIIVKETSQNKKNGVTEEVQAESPNGERKEGGNFKRLPSSSKPDQDPDSKKLKSEKSTYVDPESSSEKFEDHNGNKKPASGPIAPRKLTPLAYCKDQLRDKVREMLSEALSKVYSEANDDEATKDAISNCDANRVAVVVESAMFEKWGKSNGAQKFKYRSVMFNIKDQNNPDFRRKVLTGEIPPGAVVDLTPEEMASDERQFQNEKIKQKALFNSERAAAPKASTSEFTCGRCKKKECTYYQMQTRSADEPMTTYVTCVNCGNHWKFC
ncbi:hypothetical protein M569_15167 [Genlisea aurea]|uniref:Transcription elongation factor n=1 Tax=Genlisea aurea TaxID=192259 RepID=S8DAC0_9LAMI|nr:hypothetical protein M569_15167 [Genlisea aurea]